MFLVILYALLTVKRSRRPRVSRALAFGTSIEDDDAGDGHDIDIDESVHRRVPKGGVAVRGMYEMVQTSDPLAGPRAFPGGIHSDDDDEEEEEEEEDHTIMIADDVMHNRLPKR